MSLNPLDEKEIRSYISQIDELPTLAQSIKRLIEIIVYEIDSPQELESIIGYDQALMAKVLMIANTTLYGYRGKVSTLSKAMTVIGYNRVKSICISNLLMSLVSNECLISAAHREMLWKHSFASSKIAAEITKRRPWINGEEAAVLGLIYDIGWLVMAVHFNEQFTAIFETAARTNVPPWCVEMRYGLSHTRLSKYLVTRWAFPEPFKAVIEFHHCPERSKSFKTQVMLINLVDALSYSRERPEAVNEEMTLSYCRGLYISAEEWQEYKESVERIWPEADHLWELLN